MKNIKVKDATIEKFLKYIKQRKQIVDRGENSTMFELAQMHELNVLENFINQGLNYGD